MSYIYKVTNQINGKVYIGKTDFTVEERWREHLSDSVKATREKRPLYEALNKYGSNNFIIETIEQCSVDSVCEREQYWINHYRSYVGFADCNGYNATLGGDGKSYYDHQAIIEAYSSAQNMQIVARQFGCHPDTVKNILVANKIPIKSSADISRDANSIPVLMLNRNTREVIHEFVSSHEAVQWLYDNNLTNCKWSTARYHISEVCRGINNRKTFAGFIWQYK